MASESGHESGSKSKSKKAVNLSSSSSDSGSVDSDPDVKIVESKDQGPFNCPLCGKSIQRRTNYWRHLREACLTSKKGKGPAPKAKHAPKKPKIDVMTDVEPLDPEPAPSKSKTPKLVLTPVTADLFLDLTPAICAKLSALPEPLSDVPNTPPSKTVPSTSLTAKQKIQEAVATGPLPIQDPTVHKAGKQQPPIALKPRAPKSKPLPAAVSGPPAPVRLPVLSPAPAPSVPEPEDSNLTVSERIVRIVCSHPGMSPDELVSEVQHQVPIGSSIALTIIRATLSAFSLLSAEVSRAGTSHPDPIEFRRTMSRKCREWVDYNPF
jgi:uncharacterized C2H2 Zn-finger protein